MSFLKHKHSIGDWVIVVGKIKSCLGRIESIDGIKGYHVATLHAGMGNSFSWDNCIWCKDDGTVSPIKIDEPQPSNNRGFLKLSDEDFSKFKSYFDSW